MERQADTEFDASWHTRAANGDAERIVPETPNAVLARPKKHRKIPSDLSSKSPTKAMSNPHPSPEKRTNSARKSPTELRRPSIGSSSENSTTKTRSRGHGSRQSSRRTSRTFVDPSRPTRHYRINSSHTMPTANRNDIDDVIALHFRSCSLFENPTCYSPAASPTGTGDFEAAIGSKYPHDASAQTGHITSDNRQSLTENNLFKTSEETITPLEGENTTMHWMSPGTRKRQYAKIDRANSGFRGFISKIVPRCVSGPPPEKFYEKDQSDAGSVRRYRMSDDCEEDEHDTEEEKDLEKSTSTVRPRQISPLDRSVTVPQMKAKRWACF